MSVIAELPVHLSHFIGRDRELGQLEQLLASTRLLTLTGAGGSGKTRLATQLAARVGGRFVRVAWADLAPLTEDALLAHHVARAFHVPERADLEPIDALVADIADNNTLLVLDNCEHLVDACAALAERLLTSCPRLTIVATSREALSIASETAWLVPPMVREEAVQLFIERACAAVPSFAATDANSAAIVEICRRLDGIPLAIELAAARVRALTPAQIAERLDDAFRLLNAGSRTALPRHRTLRGTMEWSFALLNAREQCLLARLSVFNGSFSLDAAEAVCQGGTLVSDDILDGVSALVDKSLVVMEAEEASARYHLLETVRQYGRERLVDAGDVAEVERAHALYYLAMVEEFHPHLIGGEDEPGLLQKLHREDANIRVASAWSLHAPSRVEHALRFTHFMFWYWYGIGEYRDATEMADVCLRLAPDGVMPLWRARALVTKGLVALSQGNGEAARRSLGPAIELLEQHGAPPDEITTVRAKFAASHLVDGNAQAAFVLLGAMEAEGRGANRFITGVFWRFWTGWSALLNGNLVVARDLLQENIVTGFAHSHDTTIAHGSVLLGRLALLEDRIEEAHHHMREALSRYRLMAEGWGISLGLGTVARMASARGEHARAVQLQAGLDALRRRHDVGIPESERADRELVLEAGRASLGAAALAGNEAIGRALTRDQVIDLALDIVAPRPSGKRNGAVDDVYTSTAGTESTGTHRAIAIARTRLRVRALGPLQVMLGDKALEGAVWGSARPRELLLFLLLHPGGVTKEQVGLAFWPEASSAQLRNSFHVTLHRLRKVLGVPGIIAVTGERYHLEPTALEEFDVIAFERDVTAARRAMKRGEHSARPMLTRALDRYKGDLLDGEPVGDWHQAFRDHLQTLFLDASMELGQSLIADERYDAAADTFRRVLAHDALHEGAARGLMTSQSRMGERVQALRTYEKLVAGLARELEADPEASTSALAARIQRGEAL